MEPTTKKSTWHKALNRILDFIWIKDELELEQYLNCGQPDHPILELIGSIALMLLVFAGIMLWWALAAG